MLIFVGHSESAIDVYEDGEIKRLYGSQLGDQQLDYLFRFGMLAKYASKFENVHKPYVLNSFPREEGTFYVLWCNDAETLEKTGRDMSDVLVYDWADDAPAATLCCYYDRRVTA